LGAGGNGPGGDFMVRSAAVSLVILVGCGGSSFDYPNEHQYGCFRFNSAQPFDSVEALDKNSLAVVSILASRGIARDFCEVVGPQEVIILEEPIETGDGYVHGACLPGTDVSMITRSTRSLMHEMLHRWDFAHLAYGSVSHAGWDTNGYRDASDEYIQNVYRF
jgi:hypothetical protein